MEAETDVAVRYVRWYAEPAKFNVVAAEVAFYEQGTGKCIPYRVLDLPESSYGFGVEKMTDGDVLTTYQAKEAGSQVLTFDLGGHYRLGSMLYVPHNDGNYIEGVMNTSFSITTGQGVATVGQADSRDGQPGV